jgi:hypothetical protein
MSPLASFDENLFMAAMDFDRWPLAALLEEFEHVRRGNLCLLSHLQPEAWLKRGVVSDHPTSVRAIAHVMAGHAQHHLIILRERLGCKQPPAGG